MLEIFVLMILNLLLSLGNLGAAGWLAASGEWATMDGLLLTLVCLLLCPIFLLNCLWAARSQELRHWMERATPTPQEKKDWEQSRAAWSPVKAHAAVARSEREAAGRGPADAEYLTKS